MKIGIFTFWTSYDNYGQVLQSYALQNYLNNQLHLNAEIIRFYAKKPSWKIRIKRFAKEIIISFPFVKRFITRYSKDKRNFQVFKDTNIRYSAKISYGKKQLNKNSKKYDVLITGSDQVWSMMLDDTENSVYYLDFGSDSQIRISYAASFGAQEYPHHLQDNLKRQLKRLNAVSVREFDGTKICEHCGIKAIHVLDPTFLLGKDDYSVFITKPSIPPYTYLYILNIEKPEDIYWNEWKVCLMDDTFLCTTSSGYTNNIVSLDCVNVEDCSIEKWLSNIAYANRIVTTSFHGVVFSIIFEKDFIYLPLKKHHISSNNRAIDLLSKLGLEDRVLYTSDEISNLTKKHIDYSSVLPKLMDLRQHSISFLKNNLK